LVFQQFVIKLGAISHISVPFNQIFKMLSCRVYNSVVCNFAKYKYYFDQVRAAQRRIFQFKSFTMFLSLL